MIDKQFYWLIIEVLCVWRVTHLMHCENGPWEVLSGFRDLVERIGAGNLIGCFYCFSLWVAFPFAYMTGENWKEILLLWPALSAGAIMLEQIHKRKVPAAEYFEDPE